MQIRPCGRGAFLIAADSLKGQDRTDISILGAAIGNRNKLIDFVVDGLVPDSQSGLAVSIGHGAIFGQIAFALYAGEQLLSIHKSVTIAVGFVLNDHNITQGHDIYICIGVGEVGHGAAHNGDSQHGNTQNDG